MDPLTLLAQVIVLPLSVTASVVIGLAAQRYFNRKTMADLQERMRTVAEINVEAARDMRSALMGSSPRHVPSIVPFPPKGAA